MAYLSRDQVKQIIQNAPAGTSPEGLVAELRNKGHQLEGYQLDSGQEEEPNFLQKIGGFIGREIKGEEQDTNLLGKIVRGTVGQRGLLGVAQMPGKVVGTALAKKPLKSLEKSMAGLDNLTQQLIKRAREEQDPEKRARLMNVVQSNMRSAGMSQEEVSALGESVTTGREALGTAAQAGLTAATFGGMGAGASSLAAKAGISGVTGAGFTAAGQLAQDEALNVKEILIGAGMGAAIPVVSAGAKKLISSAVNKLPKRFIQSALRQSKKEILKGKDLTKWMVENKRWGSSDKLLNESQKNINSLGIKLKKFIDPVRKNKLPMKGVLESTAKSLDDFYAGIGTSADDVAMSVRSILPEAGKRLLDKKGSLTIGELDSLRQVLGKVIGDRGFLATQTTFNKAAAKSLYGQLSETIKNNAIGSDVIFNSLSKEYTLRNALLEKAATAGRGQIISFGDMFFGLPGAVVGGAPGAIGGIVAKRALQSTSFLTGTAVRVGQMGNIMSKLSPVLQGLAPAERTIVLKALGSIVTEE